MGGATTHPLCVAVNKGEGGRSRPPDQGAISTVGVKYTKHQYTGGVQRFWQGPLIFSRGDDAPYFFVEEAVQQKSEDPENQMPFRTHNF